MKLIKKVIIIVLLNTLLLPFFCLKVDGWIEVGVPGNEFDGKIGSGGSGGGIPGLSALTGSKTAFVGVMVTLIQYDSTKSTDEIELGKVLYLTGSGVLASYSTTGDFQEKSENIDHEDLYVDHTGGQSSCGHKHSWPKDISDYHISVTWSSASATELFHGFPEKIEVFDFTLGGATKSLREAVFNRGGNGRPKGLIFDKMGTDDAVRSTFAIADLYVDPIK